MRARHRVLGLIGLVALAARVVACATDPKSFCLTPCAGAIWAPVGCLMDVPPPSADLDGYDSPRDGGP